MTGADQVSIDDVVVVGGGPAGLTAAATLAPHISGRVIVLERESRAGGIPRHSDHTGYGLRDLHRVMTGPAYAQRLVQAAAAAGAQIRTEATVTGWTPTGGLQVTSPRGRAEIRPGAIVLATGARERPRAARLIPGDRVAGIYTTGHLQSAVHLHDLSIGRRAVIVGAELVSWSAVLTLREAGVRTVLMVTTHPRPESFALFNLLGRSVLKVRVRTRSRIVSINGRGRVSSVEIADLRTGARSTVACDTVVLTGDWVPENELARSAGLSIDPESRAPNVDGGLRSTRPGVFAIGNLVHPVDTADVAALDGAHVAAAVREHLQGSRARQDGIPLLAGAGLRWVAPGLVRPDEPPARSKILAWVDDWVPAPVVTASQHGAVVGRRRLPWPAAPGRAFRIPWTVLDEMRPNAGPVTLSLR